MTKSQLLWSFGIASIFNSIGSFIIMPNASSYNYNVEPASPTASDMDFDEIEEESQPKQWFWQRAWNAIPTVGGTMKEFRKTAEEVVKITTEELGVLMNDFANKVDTSMSLKFFSKCFGNFCIFSTTPAVLTTYIDQKYSLTSQITDNGLLKYLLTGFFSVSISHLFLKGGIKLFEDISGVAFGNFTTVETYIMYTMSLVESCAFKCIQEWEDKPERQTIIICDGDSELLNELLQQGS
jgi:hypothetical protein